VSPSGPAFRHPRESTPWPTRSSRPPRRDGHRPPPRPCQPARLHHAARPGPGRRFRCKLLAERFSRIGVGRFHGRREGTWGSRERRTMSDKLGERLKKLHLPEPDWAGCPVAFWTSGRQGHPCARRSRTWARCSSRGCSTSTTPRRGALDRLQGRRQRPAADRPQGPEAMLQFVGTTLRSFKSPSTANLTGRRSARSSAAAADRGTREARSSSASRCSRSTT